MTLEQLVAKHDQLDKEVVETSRNWNDVCKGHKNAMGLVDDEFRLTVEYRVARDNYYRAYNELRNFNKQANKNKELRKFLDDRSRARRYHKT